MKVALINPNWNFHGSIYFGCRAPHLPLELAGAQLLLEKAGHCVLLLDAHLFDLSIGDIEAALQSFQPDMSVLTTAPTYLFWRCAPPELRVCQELSHAVREHSPLLVAVGPHGSTTPRAALRKLMVDIVVMGECEEVLPRLAAGERACGGICLRHDDDIRLIGGPQMATFVDQEPLLWPDEFIDRHSHHHHRFDAEPNGSGAEVEASRGCPYSCTFCAKENFRNHYRRRRVENVLEEVQQLLRQGVEYIYFVDEIFLPNEPLLRGLVGLDVKFGIQTRIDLWMPGKLALLGEAGCVSIECGVESLDSEGRAELGKRCKMSTGQLAAQLIEAKRHIPFVQANLIKLPRDDAAGVQRWREQMRSAGIWANDPIPLFPYPGSPDYTKLWGAPDEMAWERALDHYLAQFERFSDIQEKRPRRLHELEMEVQR